jgi:hypothetical protein
MKKKKKKTKVRVIFPGFMELTRRKSENSLAIEVRRGDDLLGSLFMGRGSVEWWPKGNKTNSVKTLTFEAKKRRASSTPSDLVDRSDEPSG